MAGIALAGIGTVALVFGTVSTALAPPAPPVVSDRVQSYYESATKSPSASATAAKQVTFSAYGDSISSGDSADFSGGAFGPLSWPLYLGNGISYAGGWAQGGVKTETMLENAKLVKADVLVLIVGANDYANGVPFEETAANIAGMVQKTGAGKVIISSVPPRDESPELTVEYNTNLQGLAATQGWRFVDAAAGVRAGDQYAPGMTTDGIHPTEKAARIIGETIRAAILAA